MSVSNGQVYNHPLLPRGITVPVGQLQNYFDRWDSTGVTGFGVHLYNPSLVEGCKSVNPYTWRGIRLIPVPNNPNKWFKTTCSTVVTKIRQSPIRRLIKIAGVKKFCFRFNVTRVIRTIISTGDLIIPKLFHSRSFYNIAKIIKYLPQLRREINASPVERYFNNVIRDPLSVKFINNNVNYVINSDTCIIDTVNKLLPLPIGKFVRIDGHSNIVNLRIVDNRGIVFDPSQLFKNIRKDCKKPVFISIDNNNESKNHCSWKSFPGCTKISLYSFVKEYGCVNFFNDEWSPVLSNIRDSVNRNKVIPQYEKVLVPQVKELGNAQLIPSEYLLSDDYSGTEYSYDKYFGTVPQSFIYQPNAFELDVNEKVITVNHKTELFTEFPKEVSRLPETYQTNQSYVLLSSRNQGIANKYEVKRLASGLITKENIPVLPQYSSSIEILKGRDISPSARKTLDEAFQIHRCYGTNVSRTGGSYETLRRSRFNQVYDLYQTVNSGQSYIRMYFRMFTRWAQAQIRASLMDKNSTFTPTNLSPISQYDWQYSNPDMAIKRDSIKYMCATGEGKYGNILKGNSDFNQYQIFDAESTLFGRAHESFYNLQSGQAFFLDAEGLSHDVIREIICNVVSINDGNQPWLALPIRKSETETTITPFVIPGLYYDCPGVKEVLVHWGASEPEDIIPLRDLINCNFPDPGLRSQNGTLLPDDVPMPAFSNFCAATAPLSIPTIEEAIRTMVARTHSAEEARLAFELVLSRLLTIDVTKSPTFNGNFDSATGGIKSCHQYPVMQRLNDQCELVDRINAHHSKFIQPTGANELRLPFVYSGPAYFDFMYHEMTIPSPLWEATIMRNNQLINHAFIITHALSVSINWPSHTFSVDGGILDLAHNSPRTTDQMKNCVLAKRHINWLDRKTRLQTPSIWSMAHKRATSVMYGFTLSDYFWLTGPRIPKDFYLTNAPIYLSHPYRLGWLLQKVPIHMMLPSASLQPLWPKQEWTPKVYSNQIQNKVRVGRSFPVFQGFNWLQDGGMCYSLQYYLGIYNKEREYRYETNNWVNNTIQLATWDVPMQTEFPSAPKFTNPVFVGESGSSDPIDNYMVPGFVRNYDFTSNRVKACGAKVYEETDKDSAYLIHLCWQKILDSKLLTVPSITVIPPSGMPIQDLYDNEYSIISSFNHNINEVSFSMFMKGETYLTDAHRMQANAMGIDNYAVPASQFPAYLANHNEVNEPRNQRTDSITPNLPMSRVQQRPGDFHNLDHVENGVLNISASRPITHNKYLMTPQNTPKPKGEGYPITALPGPKKDRRPERVQKKTRMVTALKSSPIDPEVVNRSMGGELANHNDVNEPKFSIPEARLSNPRVSGPAPRPTKYLHNAPTNIRKNAGPRILMDTKPKVEVNLHHTPLSVEELPKVTEMVTVQKDKGVAYPNRHTGTTSPQLSKTQIDKNNMMLGVVQKMLEEEKQKEETKRLEAVEKVVESDNLESGIAVPVETHRCLSQQEADQLNKIIISNKNQQQISSSNVVQPTDLGEGNAVVTHLEEPPRPLELPVYRHPNENLPTVELTDAEAHISQNELRELIKFKQTLNKPSTFLSQYSEN
nr:capsid protein [babaco meleira-associated virus 1]